MSDEDAIWYSHWYSGELKQCNYVWAHWHLLVTSFALKSGLEITHFGARAPGFSSGKYLEFSRGRNRLARALFKKVEFQHLSFVEMKGRFETVAAECGFRASLGRHGVEVDIRLDQYDEEFCTSFGNAAADLFQSARLVAFRTRGTNRNLPMNLVGNYDNRHFADSFMATDFFDIKVTRLDSRNGSHRDATP